MDSDKDSMRLPCDPISDRRCVGSGPTCVKSATGHEDVSNQASRAKCATGRHNALQLRKPINVGTWNVRGLLQAGKLHIVERELERLNVQICGISETHWKDKGHFETSNSTVYISGAEKTGRNGVAFIVNKKISKWVKSYEAVNERILVLTIHSKPNNCHVIQVYMPTAEATEEEVEEVYCSIEDIITKIPKKDIFIVMGDINAKVGNTELDNHLRNFIGKYGLGIRNERGERLIQFAVNNNLAVANTLFKHHPRRLSTWVSPDGKYKNQIDYIMIGTRWKTSVKNVKAKPGAICGSDHKLLLASISLKLRTPKTSETRNSKLENPKTGIFHENLRTTQMPDTSTDPNTLWISIKNWIKAAVKSCTSDSMSAKKNHWISDDTIKLIDQRRQINSSNIQEEEKRQAIKHLNKRIKQECRRDKNNHLKNICAELQDHAQHGESHDLYDKVRYLAREFKPRTQIIKDKNGKIIVDPVMIAEVWRQHCKDLYKSDSPTSSKEQATPNEKEPGILKSEVEKAIRTLKNKKATGADGITAEILKAMGDYGTEVIHALCSKIWETGEWPMDWCESIFIPIHKKGSPTECNNYRTVTLIPHTSKVLLHIINERLKTFLLPQISDEQRGFVPGKGTREQILNTRQIIEKAREHNLKLYLCFVDYTKAFDSVNWSLLWKVLDEMAVPKHLIFLIKRLYQHNIAKVRTGQTMSRAFELGAGVRQGCILSPLLYNIYSEYIMRKVLDDWEGGISIGGRKMSNLRYADDTLIIAENEEQLINIMNKLDNYSRDYGLKINETKTKVMIIDRSNDTVNIRNVAKYEVVDKFVYLGSLLTKDGSCSEEIKRRLAMARAATTKLTKIWRDQTITKSVKVMLVNSLIFPIAVYSSETWTLKKTDRKRIEAFELWVYRRILRVSWVEHRTNASILQELQIKKRLLNQINKSYLSYFGHIARRTGEMENLMIEGKVEGKRSRGRSPMRWTDRLKEMTGHSMHEAIHLAQDRNAWKQEIQTHT